MSWPPASHPRPVHRTFKLQLSSVHRAQSPRPPFYVLRPNTDPADAANMPSLKMPFVRRQPRSQRRNPSQPTHPPAQSLQTPIRGPSSPSSTKVARSFSRLLGRRSPQSPTEQGQQAHGEVDNGRPPTLPRHSQSPRPSILRPKLNRAKQFFNSLNCFKRTMEESNPNAHPYQLDADQLVHLQQPDHSQAELGLDNDQPLVRGEPGTVCPLRENASAAHSDSSTVESCTVKKSPIALKDGPVTNESAKPCAARKSDISLPIRHKHFTGNNRNNERHESRVNKEHSECGQSSSQKPNGPCKKTSSDLLLSTKEISTTGLPSLEQSSQHSVPSNAINYEPIVSTEQLQTSDQRPRSACDEPNSLTTESSPPSSNTQTTDHWFPAENASFEKRQFELEAPSSMNRSNVSACTLGLPVQQAASSVDHDIIDVANPASSSEEIMAGSDGKSLKSSERDSDEISHIPHIPKQPATCSTNRDSEEIQKVHFPSTKGHLDMTHNVEPRSSSRALSTFDKNSSRKSVSTDSGLSGNRMRSIHSVDPHAQCPNAPSIENAVSSTCTLPCGPHLSHRRSAVKFESIADPKSAGHILFGVLRQHFSCDVEICEQRGLVFRKMRVGYLITQDGRKDSRRRLIVCFKVKRQKQSSGALSAVVAYPSKKNGTIEAATLADFDTFLESVEYQFRRQLCDSSLQPMYIS